MFRVALAASLALAVVPAAGVDSFGATRAATSSTAASSELRQLLGFVDGALVRIDSETLRPRPGARIAIGSGGCASRQGGTACWSNPPWTVSPDGRQLVVARNDSSLLLLVDPSTLRTKAKIPIRGGEIGALAWLAPGRILALQEGPAERQRLLALDVAKRKVVARTALGGAVQQVARTPRGLVLLFAPAGAIGTARIAVADRKGAVRFKGLPRIAAGSKLLPSHSHSVDARIPGLAVDAQGDRAFVVGDTLIADVELRSLAVSYRSLERKPSLLARIWSWLEPKASAKLVSGYGRQAAWLGTGMLAVTGWDAEQGRSTPLGLRLADTKSWDERTVQRDALAFRVAGDLLLATGGGSSGLVAYDLRGDERFRLFEGRQTWVGTVYAGRAYVSLPPEKEVRVVDLATGALTGTREPLPWLLLGQGDGWWG